MDLIERLRADAELIHNNGITRKLPRHRVATLLREAAAALEAAPKVGEGFVMVPREPTPEMLAATSWPGCAARDYAKMLAAAPTPPTDQQERA